jgi:hypothetical protein
MKLIRTIVRWFLPYREFIDRCWDLTERKSRGKAVFIYLELLFIGASFDYVARFPFSADDPHGAYRFLTRFPPSLLMTVALTGLTLSLRRVTPLRSGLALAAAVAGGYYLGAWAGLLPLIPLMQRPLKTDGAGKP